ITSRLLQAAGVPTPATYVASHLHQLAPLLDGGPLVVKPVGGTEGFGVRIVRTPAELAAVPAGKDPLFAQRYHPPQGRDRKIYSIGGRLFGVKKIFPARTEAEKHGEPFIPTPELCEITLRCSRALGIDLFGIDIVESEGRPYVVDMSSMPGFKGVPDAPSYLASYLYDAAKRAARPSRRSIASSQNDGSRYSASQTAARNSWRPQRSERDAGCGTSMRI